ncbi:MAG: hypothetical protein LBF83_11365 [Spirochaetaceae bacterium]|jgi:predicted nucleic acid-binding protein|nr:hypothetical protein [Spirochaetaceae bacterium]
MIVVSDASPIIALAVCGKLGLLDVLFEKICIPLDEKRGRTIAARKGIKTIGTIGILLLQNKKGILRH